MSEEAPQDDKANEDTQEKEETKRLCSEEENMVKIAKQKSLQLDLKIPPDIEECKRHAAYSKMEKLPMCIHPLKLAEYGQGVSLYFEMLKEFLLLSLFVVLCYGLFLVVNSFMFFHLESLDQILEYFTIKIFGNQNIMQVSSIITSFLMIGFYFAWATHAKVFREKSTSLQIKTRTCSHYTVQITGVPQIKNLKENDFIEELFSTQGNSRGFARVTFAYNISHYITLSSELKEVHMKIAKLDKYRKVMSEKYKTEHGEEPKDLRQFDAQLFNGCCGSNQNIYLELKSQEEELLALITKCEKESSEFMERTQTAYATFLSAEDCCNVIQNNRKYNSFFSKLCNNSNLAFRGFPIYLERAPEPEDILWENLHVSKTSQFCRSLVTIFTSLLIFSASLFANYFLLQYKDAPIENKFWSFVVHSVAFPCITLGINKIMKILIPILVKFEKPHTQTDHDMAVAYKLAVGMFLNSAIVPFLSIFWTPITDEYIYQTFFKNVMMNWLALVFAPPLVELVHLRYLWYLFKTWRIKRKGEKNQITQLEANEAFEPPQINFARKYGEHVAILYYTGFFCVFLPAGVLLTIIGLVLRYWVDKCLMQRRYRRPPHLGFGISVFSMEMGIGFVAALLLGHCFSWIMMNSFPDIVVENSYVYLLAPFAILLVVFVPFKLLVKCKMLSLNTMPTLQQILVNDQSTELKFKEIFGNLPYNLVEFEYDYKYYNLITREEAQIEYLQARSEMMEDEQKKRDMQEEIENLTAHRNSITSPLSCILPSPHSIMYQRDASNIPYSPRAVPPPSYQPPYSPPAYQAPQYSPPQYPPPNYLPPHYPPPQYSPPQYPPSQYAPTSRYPPSYGYYPNQYH